MSVTEFSEGTSAREMAGYGGFADAIGGIATVVLAIIGLSGAYPDVLLGIATIVFGAALLVQGGALLSEFAGFTSMGAAETMPFEQFGSTSGLSVVFLVGAAGIVLGVLALLGIHANVLTSAAVIAFGGALVLSSNSVASLHSLKMGAARLGLTRPGGEMLAGDVASGAAGIQALAGVAAIVLGILAETGHFPVALPNVALIVLGGTLILTGTSLSLIVLSFMRPMRSA